MKRIRYMIASSLDGYIAGPNGEYDWIIMDPEIDFGELMQGFDTVLMGRRSFEIYGGGVPGMKTVVVSRTLQQGDYPSVTIISDELERAVSDLRAETGKDIWLFGGGSLFRSLLNVELVDTVEVAIIPIILGEGIPLLPPPSQQAKLKLNSHKIYKTGIVSLGYEIK